MTAIALAALTLNEVSGQGTFPFNDVEYSARPYGSLCIYLKDYTDVEYKLDRNDKRALTGNVPG